MNRFRNWLIKKLKATSNEEVQEKYILKEDAMNYVGMQPIMPTVVNYNTEDIYARVIIPETYLWETQEDFIKRPNTKLDNEKIDKIINNQDIRNQLNHNMSYALNNYMKFKVNYDPKALGYVLVGEIKVVK